MEKVQDGNYVTVHYRGMLESGEEFDSSREQMPIEIRVGSGEAISGFEKALVGMQVHEKKSFTLPAGEAYGDRDEDLKRDVARKELPENFDPNVGDIVGVTTGQGRQIPATVTHVDKEKVSIDMNHPLAGRELTFEVEVVGISEEPTQEAMHCASGCGEEGCGSAGCR